jgi:hypothetical protein
METSFENSERRPTVLVSSGADADRVPWVGLGIILKHGYVPSQPNPKIV